LLIGGGALGVHELNIFQNPDVNLRAKNYAAADYIIQQAATFIRKDRDVIRLIPLVNFRDPQTPSDVGRLIPEQIAARLIQLGYKVDDTHVASPSVQTGAVKTMMDKPAYLLNGHYMDDRPNLNVSLRLTQVQSGRAVGAFDYKMPTNRELRELSKPKPQIFIKPQ